MNNNDDAFEENVEYMAPGAQPSGQILTPKEVVEASDDLRPYIQLINSKLKERECDSWLISIECDLNVEVLNHLVDEVEGAGWHVSLGGKTINIH
ncbi:hypothetical protein TK35_11740 [Lacticaseibacillus paracasei]|uniref:hypothetical protein n=1 Tax=Lacticaseibacillus paracasei TaxID=1597 RepID=UPI001062415E|nr:hypothetical protein [Lacticaseibacillus paracasei]TEA87073.1 hypothetical protein TK35_11740 [Lacticaseibacillus paracasei]TEA88870.1 hypothetical protein TK36_11720 [Lacticaseibacillus paracasei]